MGIEFPVHSRLGDPVPVRTGADPIVGRFINSPIGTQGTFPPQSPRRFPQVIHTLLTCLCMTVH